jgi:hypothetical protein
VSPDYADPNCQKCGGKGWIYAPSMLVLPGERGGRYCSCARDYMRLANMERIWKSLSEATMPAMLREEAPLKKLIKHNVWITAKDGDFRAHLKAVAFNMHDMWDARVYSDKDLLKAWLNTAYAQGHKIYDTELDESMVTVKAMYIDELVEPPELVILLLGVKQAPNKETPNVLLEAIQSRRHIGKPMWIVDQPDHRIDQMHHRGYSEQLEGLLGHWPHLRIAGSTVRRASGVVVDHVETVASDPGAIQEMVDTEPSRTEVEQIDEALADMDDEETAEEEEAPAPNHFFQEMMAAEEAKEKVAAKKESRAKKTSFRKKSGKRGDS